MRLEGTKVLVSGDFEGMSRSDVVAALEARGAVVTDKMAMDVEVVFAGAAPGADVDSAMELGVRVADAAALTAALAGAEPPAKPMIEASQLPSGPAPDRDPGPSSDSPRGATSRNAAPKSSAAPAAAKSGGTAADGTRAFEKGATVRIVGGREGIGEVGEIFWWGDSKFGAGMRAGVTGADGTKYWVDEADLAWPDDAVDEVAIKEAKAANVFARGDRIRVKSGKGEGTEATIFWWGDSKWGDGMRAGVETDDGEKLWIDAEHLEKLEGDADDAADDDIPF